MLELWLRKMDTEGEILDLAMLPIVIIVLRVSVPLLFVVW